MDNPKNPGVFCADLNPIERLEERGAAEEKSGCKCQNNGLASSTWAQANLLYSFSVLSEEVGGYISAVPETLLEEGF